MLETPTKSTQRDDYLFTENLCNRILSSLDDPIDDREFISLLFLDWLSYTCLGLKQSEAKTLFQIISNKEIHEFNYNRLKELPPSQKGLLLGFSGHLLELDDSEFFGETHPSNIVFSTIVGLAKENTLQVDHFFKIVNSSLKAFYTLGIPLNPKHYNAGWHGTGTLGTLASSISAALFLDQSASELANSIGLATTQASGIHSSYGFHSKPLNAANASSQGILSALMTKQKLTAPKDSLESKFGFFEMYNAESPTPEQLSWPKNIHFIHPKLYPSCHCTHSTIEASLQLGPRIDFENIDSIKLIGNSYAINMTDQRNPETREKAFFSSSYCLATSLVFGNPKLKDFEQLALSNPDVSQLERKVELVIDDSLDLMETEIQLYLKRGSVENSRARIERGFSETDLEKYSNKIIDQFEECGGSKSLFYEIKSSLENQKQIQLSNIFTQLL